MALATVTKSKYITERIRLDLDIEEAETLQAVLANVGGSVTRSPRKYCRAIYETLTPLAGSGTIFSGAAPGCLIEGSISFRDYAGDRDY